MQELASVIQYKDNDMKIPRYRFCRLNMSNLPTGTFTISPTSSTMCEFRVPAGGVMNWSRSFLSYQYTLPALAANFGVIHEQSFDFRQVYLGSSSGLPVADVQYADCYVNSQRPIRTKLVDYLSNDQSSQFYKCNQLNTTNLLPFSRDGLTAGTQNASSDSYLEPQYLAICPTLNTAVTVSRYVPLNSLVDTIFSLDRDLTFGQDLFFRVWSNYGQRIFYYTTSPANPSANTTQIAVNVTASNLYLQLALEENLDIKASILHALSTGSIKLSIPYQYTYRFSSAGNSAQASLSVTLTKNYGRSLKKISFVPYNAQELTNYAYDHSNANGTKVNAIQTSLSGRPNTDYILQCYNPYSSINPNGVWNSTPSSTQDDFREGQQFLKNSCLTSYPAYQTNWCYNDQWGMPWLCDQDSTDSRMITEGLDLLHQGDLMYQVTAWTAASQQATSSIYTNGLILYLFCVFVRTLQILPSGIVLSA